MPASSPLKRPGNHCSNSDASNAEATPVILPWITAWVNRRAGNSEKWRSADIEKWMPFTNAQMKRLKKNGRCQEGEEIGTNSYREKRTCTQKAFWWRSFVCDVDEVNRKTYQGLFRDTDVTHASCSSSRLPHFVLVQACSNSQPKIDEVGMAVLVRTGQDTWKSIYSSDEQIYMSRLQKV